MCKNLEENYSSYLNLSSLPSLYTKPLKIEYLQSYTNHYII